LARPSNRLAETFSLIGSLSSHQQSNAVNAAFYSEFKIRQSKEFCMVFPSRGLVPIVGSWRMHFRDALGLFRHISVKLQNAAPCGKKCIQAVNILVTSVQLRRPNGAESMLLIS
jgi:hypothetical protein